MPTLTLPVRYDDPPVLPDGHGLAHRLRRFYKPLLSGINVYLLYNGTVIPTYKTDASGAIPQQPPWDPFWMSGEDSLPPIREPGGVEQPQPYTPQIKRVFLGGHVETITTAERAALTAAGYGAFIT